MKHQIEINNRLIELSQENQLKVIRFINHLASINETTRNKHLAYISEIQYTYNKEENIIKENTLKEDTEYCLVNGTNEKSIVNGNTWEQSEVKKDEK